MLRVLLISENRSTASFFRTLKGFDFHLDSLSHPVEILNHKPKTEYDYIFCDFELFKNLPYDNDEFDSRSITLGYNRTKTRLVFMVDKGDMEEAAAYLKSGEYSYISYPITQTEISFHMTKPQGLEGLNDFNVPGYANWKPDDVVMMRTSNPTMQILYNQLGRVALKATTILLTGETGTGKGILARQIHAMSPRRNEPFVSIHCGAIPDTLLESELFGHEKGAFTGATKQKKGKFELAQGGTIFLDEVGTISESMQIKLLRVLQERTLERVGGEKSIEVDVRIITATNENLKEMCEEKRFRLDLYYRLNVFPMNLPALRDRIEDLPLLASSIIQKLNGLHGVQISGLDDMAAEMLKSYNWPGNIRELENLLERAFILESSNQLTSDSFPIEMLSYVGAADNNRPLSEGTLAEVRRQVVEKVEEEYIRAVLEANRGRIQTSAEVAGISSRQLHKLMSRYQIDKKDYK